jgi:hypothetical protein
MSSPRRQVRFDRTESHENELNMMHSDDDRTELPLKKNIKIIEK